MDNISTAFAKACSALEGAVLDLLSGPWEEAPRRRAHEMAVALRHAAHASAWWDAESELKAVESLLVLSSHEAESIRRAVGDRLLEYLALLKKPAVSRSA